MYLKPITWPCFTLGLSCCCCLRVKHEDEFHSFSCFLFCGSFLPSQIHPAGLLSSAAAWHQGARKRFPKKSSPQKPPQNRIMSMFLSWLCHYFFITAIFSSPEQNRKCDWSSDVVGTCYSNVSNNSTDGFWVITVLQFMKSHHAVLPFLWGVFEFWYCLVVFVPSHRMTKAWVVLGCFGAVLIFCYIRLFLRSFSTLSASVSVSFLLFFPSLSASSTHTPLWLQPPNQNTWPGYGKENVQTIKCNCRFDS